jgi:phospholipid/cholesterol/gamma-HCH transport system substrate-binding protein
MSAYRRNIVVGITVLTSLLVLGWMLLKFGSAPAKLFQKGVQLEVHFIADRADGLGEGSQVLYRGVPVGRITHLERDQNQQDILIDALVDDTPPLPANLDGLIKTQSLLSGSASMSLELVGEEPVTPIGRLGKDQVMQAKYVGSDLIPQQFGQLAAELVKTTHDVRDARLVTHLDETVRAAADVLKSLHDYVSDPKLREDITVSIATFREVTEKADRAATNVEKFSGDLQKLSTQASTTIQKTQDDIDQVNRQLNDRLLQISKLLDTVQSITTKVDTGKGSAGLLLNDPKLYQSLIDSSKELNATISDLRRLVEQWEQEGVSLKLK